MTVTHRQTPLWIITTTPLRIRYLNDVRAAVDAPVQHSPRAPLRHPRHSIDHRLVRRTQVVAQEMDGHHEYRFTLIRPSVVVDDRRSTATSA